MPHPLPRALLLPILLVLLSSCARTPAATFYTLSPLARQQAQRLPPVQRQLSVAILPVQIPDHLNRPQIVTQEDQNVVKVSEFHRWAAPLGDNITAVIAENLRLLLGSDLVFATPGLGIKTPDYTVAIQILRLECRAGDKVVLEARYGITHGNGRSPQFRLATFTRKLSDKRYETIVAGTSQAIQELSREIADEISKAVKTGI